MHAGVRVIVFGSFAISACGGLIAPSQGDGDPNATTASRDAGIAAPLPSPGPVPPPPPTGTPPSPPQTTGDCVVPEKPMTMCPQGVFDACSDFHAARVRGYVKDASDRPVTGATVWVSTWGPTQGGRCLVESVTDAQGGFDLDVPSVVPENDTGFADDGFDAIVQKDARTMCFWVSAPACEKTYMHVTLP